MHFEHNACFAFSKLAQKLVFGIFPRLTKNWENLALKLLQFLSKIVWMNDLKCMENTLPRSITTILMSFVQQNPPSNLRSRHVKGT